jgi:O-acetylhomoserine (thiol)-lyase
VVPLRNMGAAISPFNAFLILQGIETLALRMDRICDQHAQGGRVPEGAPQGEWVNYAGLPDHADHALVQKYMGGRASGILTFGVKGGRKPAAASRTR